MAPQEHPRVARRHVVLGCAALATFVASIWALDDVPEAAADRPLQASARPAASAARGAPSAEAGAVLALALPERGAFQAVRRNLFAGSAAPAPASAPVAAVVAASAPVPAAPPPPPPITMPFTYAGRLVTAAGPSVLLNDGALTRVLAVGASAGDFRFDEDVGNQLVFTHVPSGERVVLALQP